MNIHYNVINNSYDHYIGGKVVDSYTRFPEGWLCLTIPKIKFWEFPNLVLASKLEGKTKSNLDKFVKQMRDQRWRTCDTFQFTKTVACASLTCTGYVGDIPVVRHIFV